MTGTLHTYGIHAIKVHGGTIKKIKDIGTVIDLKATYMSGARPERKFELEHLRLLRSAIKALGVKLECTPMLDGTPLEPVMIGVDIRGNITISDEGEVQVTVRTVMDDLEEHGLSVELLMKASNCLELTADEQQTLEEAIQSELTGTQTLEEAVADAIQAGADSLPADTSLFINGKKVKRSQDGAQA